MATVGVIETEVAFAVCHVNVVSCPLKTEGGLAVKLLMVGGVLAAVTVTVALPVTLPFAPTAVSVYTVVAVGLTWSVPLAATLPMP